MALIREGTVEFEPNISADYENYNAKSLSVLYEFEQRHFWFKNRRQVIADVFEKYIAKTERIIEIGAGTGNVVNISPELSTDSARSEHPSRSK